MRDRTDQDTEKAEAIYRRYSDYYDGEVQGCCLLIADEIQRTIGGEVVAGYLTWYFGTARRPHWWVAKGDAILDPMGDYLLSQEEGPDREEVHRSRTVFDAVLPQYEHWRVAS